MSLDDKELCMNTNVLNYFLIYVRMLITLNLLFESESYDSHVIVRAKAYWVLRQKQRVFSDDKWCRVST